MVGRGNKRMNDIREKDTLVIIFFLPTTPGMGGYFPLSFCGHQSSCELHKCLGFISERQKGILFLFRFGEANR